MTTHDYRHRTAVIGAAGRIGLAFSLVLARAGHRVYGIDRDSVAVASIRAGVMPFYEEGAGPALQSSLCRGAFSISSDIATVRDADYVVVLVGTPSPDMRDLNDLADDLSPQLRPGHVVILRSTLSPGTANRIFKRMRRAIGAQGAGVCMAVVPERSIEGQGLAEMPVLPSIIGADTQDDFDRVAEFCRSYSSGACVHVTPTEAEFAKLVTNVSRYVSFSLSNEFARVGDQHGVNIHRVMDAAGLDYPRLSLPSPGANVGGPCLPKDSEIFVASDPSGSPLVRSCLDINEMLPSRISNRVTDHFGKRAKVAVLGMTFKRGSDDTRGSLSPELCEQLKRYEHRVVCVEPHLPGYDDLDSIAGSDAVVLMTPHDEFLDRPALARLVNNRRCLYVDLWGAWPDIRYLTRRGYWQEEVQQ